jgi:hypothetical protein
VLPPLLFLLIKATKALVGFVASFKTEKYAQDIQAFAAIETEKEQYR